MQIEILPTADAAAARAAVVIANIVRNAVTERGRCSFAVSGGRTPWQMLRELASESLPWDKVHLFQTDERVAPQGDADRNLTHIAESLLTRIALPAANMHAMPVEVPDLDAAGAAYAGEIASVAGTPATFDLIHLGLGPDGHTASLVPGDPVLDVTRANVAITHPYQGHCRMTLTFPVLDNARRLLWIVTGAEKVEMLKRLQASDRSIPAGRVRPDQALIIADAAAAGG
jgi:6-phosphogluconolactonase